MFCGCSKVRMKTQIDDHPTDNQYDNEIVTTRPSPLGAVSGCTLKWDLRALKVRVLMDKQSIPFGHASEDVQVCG